MNHRETPHAALMTPAQAAATLRVAPRTVARWAAAGKITSVRTPGGHRRYLAVDVRAHARRWGSDPISVPNAAETARTGP